MHFKSSDKFTDRLTTGMVKGSKTGFAVGNRKRERLIKRGKCTPSPNKVSLSFHRKIDRGKSSFE